MTGFARFFFIVIIIYVIFRLLIRYVFPFIVKRYLKRFQNNFYEQNPHLKNQQQKKEGEVNIEHDPSKNSKKKGNDDIGEYVDYEEVE